MKTNHPFIDSLDKIEKSINELKVLFLKDVNSKLVYSNKDLITLMGISSSTLKRWRKEGVIGYSVVFNKFFYRNKDIQIMLENHFVSAKKKV